MNQMLAKPKKRPGIEIATVKAGEMVWINLRITRRLYADEVTAWVGRVLEVDQTAIRIKPSTYSIQTCETQIVAQGAIQIIPWSRIAYITLIEEGALAA